MRNNRLYKFKESKVINEENENEKPKMGIRIEGFNGNLNLYFHNLKIIEQVYRKLSQIFIQSNINKYYIEGKLIGKGNFASVTVGFDVIKKNQYAIKSIQKDKLLKNSKSLVNN